MERDKYYINKLCLVRVLLLMGQTFEFTKNKIIYIKIDRIWIKEKEIEYIFGDCKPNQTKRI